VFAQTKGPHALVRPFYFFNGAPGEIRTPDLLVRSQALYPTELRAQKLCRNPLPIQPCRPNPAKPIWLPHRREGLFRASMHSTLRASKRSLRDHSLFKFVPTNLSNPRVGLKYHPTKSLSNERAQSPFIRKWRRERDSNPRWAFDPYALSRGAPSTTRPSLRSLTGQFRIEGNGPRKQ
jgi:hypothetical protein